MNLEQPRVDNRLQLFPHNQGWAIFDENTYRFSDVFIDFAHALRLAKQIALENQATLMVRDHEGEVILKTAYS